MRIGIAGVGVIGGALSRYLKTNTSHEILHYDPRLDLKDDLSSAEALFVCVPVPNIEDELGHVTGQDLSIVKEVLGKFGSIHQKIFIRSTCLPGTSDALSDELKLNCFSMPEFLTERIANQDMETQGVVCGSYPHMDHAPHYAFVSEIFEGEKDILMMSNVEAELAKYAHNGHGTIKVSFSNDVYDLCRVLRADYEKVRKGYLMSGYISKAHTQVPGPDGGRGYFGKCFPKDMGALVLFMAGMGVYSSHLHFMQIKNKERRPA